MIALASIFGDGMVLQREQDCFVWGTSDPDEAVVLTLGGHVGVSVSSPSGTWMVKWTGLRAGGPFELTEQSRVLAKNVWVGDVWLCSGQSNMERNLMACAEWPDDALEFRGDPGIRQLCLPNQFDFGRPKTDIPGARWIGADTDDVRLFSAAAFHFARDLRKRTGVPQGLVLNAVGGSSAQAWLSAQALEAYPKYLEEARQFAEPGWLASLQASDTVRRDAWYATLQAADPKDPSVAGSGPWQTGPVPSGPGCLWFRKTFTLTEPHAGSLARLTLGTLVDNDDVWVNGTWVGSTGYQYPSRCYPVQPGLLVAGENTILIRLVAPRGDLGFTPDKKRSLVTATGFRLALTEPWEWRRGAEAPYLPADTFLPMISHGLHNGLLLPLVPLSFQAVLWYQGESNTANAQEYDGLLRTLIAEWRRLWKRPGLPFIIVQLPLFGSPAAIQPHDGWAGVREVQASVRDLPNVEVVIALDLGEWNDLHPANKEGVGLRMALVVRKLVLGEPLGTWTGPLLEEVRRVGREVSLRFGQVANRLTTADRKPLGGFYLVDLEGTYHRAEARIVGNTVVVGHPAVGKPVEVRYAWACNPSGANLVNDLGLPASPFRAVVTD